MFFKKDYRKAEPVVAKKYGQAEAANLVDSIVQQVEVMLSEPDDKEKVHL